MSACIRNRIKFLQCVRSKLNFSHHSKFPPSRLCSTGVSKRSKLEDYFFDKDVQSILYKITGLNYDKIYRPRKEKLANEKFQFVSDEDLKKMYEKAQARALEKLQMPPVMDIREPCDDVLSKDPELQYYVRSKLLFIDTSPGRTPRNRIITARETDGTLRKADWDERFRMNQIFFPMEGRNLETPKLFEDQYLEKLLNEESYEFVLDSACVQYEPDDPEYHRVTHTTYEHIKSTKKFDDLRSTRHFGPMAFYYAVTKDVDPLLVDMVERQLIDDAADTIRLLYLLNPELKTSQDDKASNNLELVQAYLERNKSPKTARLELALQTYLETQNNEKVENKSV